MQASPVQHEVLRGHVHHRGGGGEKQGQQGADGSGVVPDATPVRHFPRQ